MCSTPRDLERFFFIFAHIGFYIKNIIKYVQDIFIGGLVRYL